MKNHVNHLIFQILCNIAEIREEIPVSPAVALDRQRFIYDWLDDRVSDS